MRSSTLPIRGTRVVTPMLTRVAHRALVRSQTLSHLEPCRLRESSIGDLLLKHCLTLLLMLLLAGPTFGQQEQPPELASLVAAAKRAQAADDYAAAAESYKPA